MIGPTIPIVVLLTVVACAKAPLAEGTSAEPPSDDRVVESDCGGTTSFEYDESPGEPTRSAAIEAMIERWQKSIDEGVFSVAGGENEFPDGIATLELALKALPEVERNLSPSGVLTVQAVTANGENWGSVVIGEQASGGYVIDAYSVNHEAGEVCPPIE